MARKRDYKAEYRAAQRRAKAAGYKSPHEYKQARKALGTPRGASPLPKKVARKVIRGNRDDVSREWARRHSKSPATAFKASWSEGRKERFYRTFVLPDMVASKPITAQWKRDFKAYLVPDVYTEAEFNDRYPHIAQ